MASLRCTGGRLSLFRLTLPVEHSIRRDWHIFIQFQGFMHFLYNFFHAGYRLKKEIECLRILLN